MADSSKRLSAAEIQFKKTQQPAAGKKKAVPEYEIDAIALNKRTEQLKALRLARDAAEAAANPAGEAAKKPARSRRKGKSKGTLSDWLKGQREDGHNN